MNNKGLAIWKPTKEQVQGIDNYIEAHKKSAKRLPTIERLAIELGISSETVREWGRKYAPISRRLSTINDLQRDYLMQNPSAGNVFLLKALHNLQDTKEIKQEITYKIDNRPLDVIAGEIVTALNASARKKPQISKDTEDQPSDKVTVDM